MSYLNLETRWNTNNRSVAEQVRYTKVSLSVSKGTCFFYKNFSFEVIFVQTCIAINFPVPLAFIQDTSKICHFWVLSNPFVSNAPFLYLLKTSENLTVFWYFQGVEKRCTGNEWVNFEVLKRDIYLSCWFRSMVLRKENEFSFVLTKMYVNLFIYEPIN